MSNTSSATGRPVVPVEARPEPVVVGATGPVDHDELAVQDRGSRAHPDREPGELRQSRGEIEAGRVDDPDVTDARALRRADERDDPVTAPRRLEQVVGGVERVRAGDRPHGRHVARGGERRVEPEGELLVGGHGSTMVAP